MTPATLGLRAWATWPATCRWRAGCWPTPAWKSRPADFLLTGFPRSIHETEFDQLQRAAEFFAEIGAQFLITSSRPVPERMLTAGHVTGQRQDGLLDYQWTQMTDSLTQAAYVSQRDFDLPLLFRNQLGSYVETGDEMDQLISMTDPDNLRLAPDIGYLAYAGADPLAFVRTNFERIAFVTLKDLDVDLHEQHIGQKGTLEEFWDAGGFLELGQGDVDIAGVVSLLRERGVQRLGWPRGRTGQGGIPQPVSRFRGTTWWAWVWNSSRT